MKLTSPVSNYTNMQTEKIFFRALEFEIQIAKMRQEKIELPTRCNKIVTEKGKKGKKVKHIFHQDYHKKEMISVVNLCENSKQNARL